LKTGIPIRGGLARLVAASYVCKSFTLKDWLAFAEVFGMPIRVGKFGPKATEEDIGILVSAVANLGTDAAAVIPDTMKIEFEESVNAAGGGVLFQALAKYLDEGVSKAVLGQTSSADSGASGLGGGQRAKLHGDVKTDIRDDDANKCARTLCRDWVRPIVDLNFGRRERYPRVRIALKEPDDLVSLSQALPPFLDRGLKIPAATIYAKFGFDPPEGDEDVLVPLAKPGGPPSAPPETNRAQNDQDEIDRLRAQALGDWEPQLADVIAPIRQALDQATSPEDFERRLTALRGQLNTSKFQAALALAMFQSRVAGEAGEHD
jgi:phage gp29-like protein